ncbi:MAG: hypothetical protein V3V00_15625 [Saprospiraceae bacterium]
MQPYIRPMDILGQNCTDDGLPDGDADASGNFATPTRFFVLPDTTETFEIYKFGLIFTTTTAFEAGNYGDGTILANGIKVTLEGDSVSDTTLLHDFLGGETVKTNASWEAILNVGTIIERVSSPAALQGDILFTADLGAPVRISGALNQRFVVTLEDDFTSRVVDQRFYVSGQKVV